MRGPLTKGVAMQRGLGVGFSIALAVGIGPAPGVLVHLVSRSVGTSPRWVESLVSGATDVVT